MLSIKLIFFRGGGGGKEKMLINVEVDVNKHYVNNMGLFIQTELNT